MKQIIIAILVALPYSPFTQAQTFWSSGQANTIFSGDDSPRCSGLPLAGANSNADQNANALCENGASRVSDYILQNTCKTQGDILRGSTLAKAQYECLK